MASPDNPTWQAAVHAEIRNWGTRQPLKLRELTPALYARDGRPIQESDVAANPAGVANRHTTLTFPDGREGLEGNFSAYESVSREFDQVLATLSHIRSVVYPYESGHDIDKLGDVVGTLTNLSGFLVLRADNPVRNGEVSTEVAGVTKIARGLMKPFDRHDYQTISTRYTGMQPQSRTDFTRDTDAFMQHVVGSNFLLTRESRRTGTACPAPLAIISKVVKVFLEEPAPGMQEAGVRLGLSNDEILRAKDFGHAIRTATAEQQLSQMMLSLYAGRPEVQRAMPTTERTIRNNIAAANRALGRGRH